MAACSLQRFASSFVATKARHQQGAELAGLYYKNEEKLRVPLSLGAVLRAPRRVVRRALELRAPAPQLRAYVTRHAYAV